MPDMETVRVAAREVVRDMIGATLPDDESLISSGRIDSLSILNLISRMEGKLGIRLKTGGLQPDDFDTIDLIAETVLRAKA
jgi:acyl carrier protein